MEEAALGVFAIIFVAAAFPLLSVALLKAIADVIRAIPLVPNALADGVEHLGQKIANFFGKVFSGLESLIGHVFHSLARAFDSVWNEVTGAAHLLLQIAEFLDPLAIAVRAATAIAHGVAGAVHGIDVELKRIEKRWKGIEHGLKQLGKLIAAGLGVDLIFHILDVIKQWHKFHTKLLPHVLKDIAGLKKSVQDLWKAIPNSVPIPGSTAWTAAVTAVLAAVGLDWIACKGRTSANGKSGCGLWDDLASLLFAAGIFGAALDFRDIVKAAVQLDALGAEAVHELTILDDAAINDAAKSVSAAVKLIAAAPTATGF